MDWLGEPQPIEIEEEAVLEADKVEDGVRVEYDDGIMRDYANWTELSEIYGAGNSMSQWDDAGIPYAGQFLATMTHPDGDLDTIMLWPEHKLALCEADKLSSTARFEARGWRFMDANAEPDALQAALKGGD